MSLVAESRSQPARVFPEAQWDEAAPESQGIDPTGLRRAVDCLAEGFREHGGVATLAIVRHGYLVWKGPAIDQEHQIYSATKSFTSTVLGLHIDDGKASLNTLAWEYMPHLRELYPTVTLRHFATMTSGYDGAAVSYELDAQGRGDSWTPDPPAAPLFPPGTRFRYWDEAMMQFGNVLAAIAGEPLDTLFRRRIAEPIGMVRWRWDAGNWTGGIHTTSRELARFGLLFLNGGQWKGRQVISENWVAQATSVQVPTTIPDDDLPRSKGSGSYGYNWWVNGLRPTGRRMWPDAPPRTYLAKGLYTNVCIVVPKWDMVIARTNGPAGSGTASSPENVDEVWNDFFAVLGEAVSM